MNLLHLRNGQKMKLDQEKKFFKNQIENTLAPAYILTDNRIVIVDMNDNNKPVKEIKITDYKKSRDNSL